MTTPFEFLATRRSIPAAFLAEPGPDAEALGRILRVATRVPDHGKLAPWRFVVIEGEARRAAGEALAARRAERSPPPRPEELDAERERFARAPTVIVLVSRMVASEKATEWEEILSAGAVAMNLLNAAHALGYAANWLTDWPAYDDGVRTLLGLGEGERIAGFFHIGTPCMPPQERWRPELGPLVTRWTPPAGPSSG
ncbi:MAG: nitroreductase family protein [Bauldia sp.]